MTITTILAGQNYNKTIRKYDSDAITVTPDIDYSGWTIKYLVKTNPDDLDSAAIIFITPEIVTIDGIKKIVISFNLDVLDNINKGTYYHALKVVSSNNLTAKTLFTGLLNIIEPKINYPKGS